MAQTPANEFDQPAGSYPDPKGENLDAERWLKAFYQTWMEALRGTAPNEAGLAFQNLNVYAHSTLPGYQPTIGNAPHVALG
jgi:hypothetical protein